MGPPLKPFGICTSHDVGCNASVCFSCESYKGYDEGEFVLNI